MIPNARQAKWWLSILAMSLLGMTVAALISTICPHVPRVHDEFSNLLLADTILHGRLSNPTPVVWEPLQSFHVIMEPSYSAKYPLGQGLFIALGWSLTGLPIAGSWVAAGCCVGGITWMLGGITTRRWSIVGGLLVALHPAMQVTWSQSLLGGWIAAFGSALVAGGIFRLRRRHSWCAATALGVGVGVLALSRPFEGLVCSVLSAVLLWQLWDGRPVSARIIDSMRCFATAIVPVSLALTLTALQNQATTGSIARMPYQVHEASYGVAPLFVFGQAKRPAKAKTGKVPRVMDDYHRGWSLNSYENRKGVRGWLIGYWQSAQTVWTYWGFSFAMIPLASVVYWGRFRIGKLLAVMLACQLLLSSTVCWIYPHYLAPVLPWLVALTIIGLKPALVSFCRRTTIRMQTAIAILILAQCALLAASVLRLAANPKNTWAVRRETIQRGLQRLSGKHLVLVEYTDEHNVHEEWVYNGADLESEPVIWARGESDEWEAALRNQYGGERFVWKLDADSGKMPSISSSPAVSNGSGAAQPNAK